MSPTVRESKIAAVRRTVSEAALSLAVERGWENVRVEDIAASAGMSPRSFGNYFRSKNEALYAVDLDRSAAIREYLRERPSDEPLWEAVVNATLRAFMAGDALDRDLVSKVRLAVAASPLGGEYLKVHAAREAALAAGIAERLGVDVDADIYPRLMAATVAGAVRVAIEFWIDSGQDAVLSDSIRAALEKVSVGLPEPPR
ncbi:acyl-CoA-like ligand-binding transcription factor [Actinomadura sp. 3N407]|uniref:acyl-CoA-like ligand-binding transcription factor n=1 Tax=Actinomadura sp. 3N407 TaxID=3457423 RepID=UPI003FCCF508